jgi:SecD/SecF fusion protein
MKRFLFRILVCLVPTLIAIGVVARAYDLYAKGQGGFVLGVDLVGGTILVYEVDETKMPENFKAEDLAAALKRRIDPADLYNITIRPVPGTPPRVEIILPTGGLHQARVEQENWEKLLEEAGIKYAGDSQAFSDIARGSSAKGTLLDEIDKVLRPKIEAWVKKATAEDKKGKKPDWKKQVLPEAAREFPPAGSEDPYARIPDNDTKTLINRIAENEHTRASNWIESKTTQAGGKGRRMLTGDEVENIKNLIARQGRLEFRILANTEDDADAIRAAAETLEKADPAVLDRLQQRAEPPPPPVRADGSLFFPSKLPNEPEHTYSWVEVGKSYLYTLGLNSQALEKNPRQRDMVNKAIEEHKAFPMGTNLFFARKITDWTRRNSKDRELGKTREFFVLVRNPLRGQEITGDYLVRASAGHDQRGRLAIDFVFNAEGGELFHDVTTRNRPSGGGETGFKRQLAIIFDSQVTSAPSLISPIRTRGQITGEFTQQEVDDSVRILRAGALPATLKKDPVSENSMGATLGADTIYWGTLSVGCAFLTVMIFMIFYYRFAGIVACIALLVNLLLTVAFMVLVQAAFTLPGLAGLVLMLGMAVDANVLIYERLREERERGANLSMALRNGYDRAFPTILDTHLTSIFTAIVLYVVGNDQLKGFGISLTVGLIISLFTSLYMTRTLFEIWLYKGWLKKLSFFGGLVRLIHIRYWDFMSIRYYWFTATITLTILGAGLFIYRADTDPAKGKATVLNIDFTGGTAFTGRLNKPMNLTDLRHRLEDRENPLPDLSIEQIFVSADKDAAAGESSYFTVRTSEKDDKKVLAYISQKMVGEDGKPLLKLLRLDSTLILSPDNPANATGALLTFTDEAGKQDFASPSQVQRVIATAFTERNKSPTAFSLDRPPAKRDWKELLAEAARTFPVATKTDEKDKEKAKEKKAEENPYQDVPDNDRKALVAAILKARGTSPARSAEIEKWVASKRVGRLERDSHFSELTLRLSEPMTAGDLQAILTEVQNKFSNSPQPERLEIFDKQLAGSTQERALYAILASWAAILLYLWFRFGNWTFGAATVLCLIHDLFFTLGVIAAAHYVHGTWFGNMLGIQDFKIDLQSVAALLTLVGYSVNDTIVVFDRIREVRGKNPALTPQMINDGVNQTLTRTILASATVFLVVFVLYIMGGEGVKLFAFVMIVGVVVGTYSSIYIASPLLLIFGEGRHRGVAIPDRTAPAPVERT